MKINKKLFPIKAHYFLFNAGQAPIIPFVPVLIKQLGFSSIVVGSLYTIMPIAAMLAKPLAGGLADRYKCQKSIFLTLIFITIISYYIVPWVPPVPSQSKAELHCDVISDIQICNNALSDKCFINKIQSLGNNNATIECKMVCTAEEPLLASVCKEWGQEQYCGLLRPAGKGRLFSALTAHLENSTTEATSVFVTTSPQQVNFNVSLLPEHTSLMDKCLLVRFGNATFPNGDRRPIFCNNFARAECSLDCNSTLINELSVQPRSDKEQFFHLYQFWLLSICLIAGWVSMAVVVSVGDTICFDLLGDSPNKYGNQRLWGSIGWGLFSLLAGYLVDLFSDSETVKDYTPSVYLMVALLVLDICVSTKLRYNQSKKSPNILRDVGTLLTNVRVIVFLLWCISVGICTAFAWNYLFWFLEDLAHSNGGCDSQQWIKTLEGLISAVQCFGGELPFFFISGWILKHLGHINTMTLVLFSFGVRFLLYSFLENPWWCLPIELLQGLTFGIFYSAMATYASVVAPPGTETTIQGLVGAVFEGVGVSIGSFIGGIMFSQFSGKTVFRIIGIASLIGSIIHVVVQFILSKLQLGSSDTKDFTSAKYATPNDAIDMLVDFTEFPAS